MENNFDTQGGSATEEQILDGYDNVDLNDTTEALNDDFVDLGSDNDGFQDFDLDGNDEFVNIDDSWEDESDQDESSNQEEEEEIAEEEEEELNFDSLEDDGEEDVNFDDLPADVLEDKSVKSESEILEDLKAKGYQITAPEDKDAVRLGQINQLGREIETLEKVLNFSDKDFIKISVRNELVQKYNSEGKSNEIDGDDFNQEMSDEIDQLELSDVYRRSFLLNQKGSLKHYINDKRNSLDAIKKEHQNALEQKLFQIKKTTEQSVVKIAKEYKLNKKEAVEAFKFIQSDEYKELANNPDFIAQSVIAELAKRKGIKLFEKGNSYARGVQETLDEIRSNGKGKQSKSQLSNQMRGTNPLGTSQSRVNSWAAFNRADVKEEVKKDVYVAGRV